MILRPRFPDRHERKRASRSRKLDWLAELDAGIRKVLEEGLGIKPPAMRDTGQMRVSIEPSFLTPASPPSRISIEIGTKRAKRKEKR